MISKFQESKFYQTINSIVTNRVLRQGLPMLILVVGGSFAFTIVQKIKFDHKRNQQQVEHLRLSGLEKRMKPVSLEEEYEKLQKVDTTYQNVRGPRPYEDNTEWEAQKELQEKRFQEKLEQMNKSR
ncbi:cytochrome c oxidase assembly protein COX16 homolog, mitochondrial-like [Planococcus citri]|uniref:cytochrome c oxidase assembly protein COX16 homolog, mitochondrial-like n=1 Tax=Planococcus citri TaxID=170843 RepID=UPI0031F84150